MPSRLRPYLRHLRGSKALWVALCALGACASSAPQKAYPPLWLIADSDTRIYLLGTIHALPDGMDWDDGVVGQAIAEADALVMELSPQEIATTSEVLIALAPAEETIAVAERLPVDMRPHYQTLILDLRLRDSELATLDDWAVALLISNAMSQRAGLLSQYGVEATLSKRFAKQGKEISGLETAEQQIMIFESLPAKEQRQMLVRTIAGASAGTKAIETLVNAWSHAAKDKLAENIREEFETLPQLKHSLITKRNHHWAQWIEQRLEQPGTLLLAVGVGHLVGDESVPILLEKNHIVVESLQ